MSNEKVFIRTFKEVMREQLIQKNSVHVEGLGRFENQHQQQVQMSGSDGQVVMMPPCDRVVFTPDKQEGE